ncbi:MAG: NusA-like transcription termination signal-binding factor [Candidatus Parvarchaeota archaeon]|nr:NusA-like transcription termination signal-binding factor [Candidatus Parvarchaeota archaeon]
MSIKLDSDTISVMNVFSDVTSIPARDSFVEDDKVIFVVSQGQAGIAIGKNGVKIKMLQEMLKKEVIVIEYSDDPVKLFENVIHPNKLLSGYVANDQDGSRKLDVYVDAKPSRSRVKLVKSVMQRYFNITNVNIR